MKITNSKLLFASIISHIILLFIVIKIVMEYPLIHTNSSILMYFFCTSNHSGENWASHPCTK